MDQFKSFGYEDLTISTKSLLDYGCLESILIPPSDKFEGFNPSINKAINLIQVEMMDYISIKTITFHLLASKLKPKAPTQRSYLPLH